MDSLKKNILNKNIKDFVAKSFRPIKSIKIEEEKQKSKEVDRDIIRKESLEIMQNMLQYVKEDINYGLKKKISDIFHRANSNDIILNCLTDIRNKDLRTFEHSINTAVISTAIGAHLKLNNKELSTLYIGALLHDIGKCKVPDEILKKEGTLTQDEREEIEKHPQYGYKILKNTYGINDNISKIALQHHEKINGSGYPQGLEAEQINKLVRICTIADMYDAMTTNRVYRKAICSYKVVNNLCKNSSILIDNRLMTVFCDNFDIYKGEGRRIAMDYTDKLLKEFYLCLSQKFSYKYNTDEKFNSLTTNRLNRLSNIVELKEEELENVFKSFGNYKKMLHEIFFDKVYNNMKSTRLKLEDEHWNDFILKTGDPVEIKGYDEELNARWAFLETLISDQGLVGKILPYSLYVHGDTKQNKDLTKYVPICKLRKFNPEY